MKPKAINVEDAILTTAAADILGVSRRRVQAMVAAGQLSIVQRIGRVMLLSRREVMRLSKRERPEGWPKGRPRKPA